MRLVYLCTADPPPPNSDYPVVLNFFESIPQYLYPRTRDNNSPHMLYFADRVGENWLPEFHDFAIVFLTERFLSSEKALACLARASLAFPNIVCIDLYNNLSAEQLKLAKKYSKRIFSPDAGKEFLLTTFPEIAAAFDMDAEKLAESIETDGYKYLDKTIEDLKQQKNNCLAIGWTCYGVSFLLLLALLGFTFWRFWSLPNLEIAFDVYKTVILCVEMVVLSTVTVSISRFLFLLGKSFMVESIRNADRAHAIGLGRLYLKLYKDKFKWGELKDVLKNWNIDKGSAFRTMDAKDIEAVSLDQLTSIFKN